jgi:hypothetical protein
MKTALPEARRSVFCSLSIVAKEVEIMCKVGEKY